jgi:Fe-S-cluster containining protein
MGPELFVLAHDQPEPADDGFILKPDGWPQGLPLDKRGRFAPGRPCVFLVELGGGHARCGIYRDRPAVCRTYPLPLRGEGGRVRADALCPDGAWTELQLGEPWWESELSEYRRRWAEYAGVVDRWNQMVRTTGSSFRVPDYLKHLLNVYDAVSSSGGEAPIPRLVAAEGQARSA